MVPDDKHFLLQESWLPRRRYSGTMFLSVVEAVVPCSLLVFSLLASTIIIANNFKVRKEGHRYLQEAEVREEAGTPAIVESIRAGLVFQLKASVGTDLIMEREHALARFLVIYVALVFHCCFLFIGVQYLHGRTRLHLCCWAVSPWNVSQFSPSSFAMNLAAFSCTTILFVRSSMICLASKLVEAVLALDLTLKLCNIDHL
jgi:hypothetical protein